MTKTQAQKARDRRNANIVNHFDTNYGRDDTKLEIWQKLCEDLGFEVGSSVSECKSELKGIYVNIVDFVAAKQANEEVRIFRSYKALQAYTLRTDRFFPLKCAKQSPILKWMLVTL
ncbi:hypothetical protein LTR37_013830 [Vermiconidia calcicola]|uniref:Uncharacterized protein n=1 Tax=Vermiconidia calcicola TaxID=1690605 RepID=A0ACC3MV71_9PEZI|nr:hypothetical protein LTR37_013830 [Vermiconidia calcicola]